MIENLKEITLQNLPSLIDQVENESTKQKQNRIKAEKELENRRVCILFILINSNRQIKIQNTLIVKFRPGDRPDHFYGSSSAFRDPVYISDFIIKYSKLNQIFHDL